VSSRFLSDEQRARYRRYVGNPNEEQLARHFHLDAADRELLGQMRGAHNRIGFAVQLGTARFLGTFLDDPTETPAAVIKTIARQLGEASAPSLDFYRNGRQRWRHTATIREHYGFRDLEEDKAAGFRLTRWLYVLCWTGEDRPGLLFDRATTWLLAHKVLLPGITTLERLIGRVRQRATLRLWHRLTSALTDDQRQKLVALVASDDDTANTLDDLRTTPKRRSPTELLRHLERIDTIRKHGLGLMPRADLPASHSRDWRAARASPSRPIWPRCMSPGAPPRLLHCSRPWKPQRSMTLSNSSMPWPRTSSLTPRKRTANPGCARCAILTPRPSCCATLAAMS
jgi:hypothetical protein